MAPDCPILKAIDKDKHCHQCLTFQLSDHAVACHSGGAICQVDHADDTTLPACDLVILERGKDNVLEVDTQSDEPAAAPSDFC
jgi:hypothetical protein